eukprot:1893464-Rhodomonas_salina.4
MQLARLEAEQGETHESLGFVPMISGRVILTVGGRGVLVEQNAALEREREASRWPMVLRARYTMSDTEGLANGCYQAAEGAAGGGATHAQGASLRWRMAVLVRARTCCRTVIMPSAVLVLLIVVVVLLACRRMLSTYALDYAY